MRKIRRAFTEEMIFELGLEGWLGFPWEWGRGGGRKRARDEPLHTRESLGCVKEPARSVPGLSVQVAGDEAGEVGRTVLWRQLDTLKNHMQFFKIYLNSFYVVCIFFFVHIIY